MGAWRARKLIEKTDDDVEDAEVGEVVDSRGFQDLGQGHPLQMPEDHRFAKPPMGSSSKVLADHEYTLRSKIDASKMQRSRSSTAATGTSVKKYEDKRSSETSRQNSKTARSGRPETNRRCRRSASSSSGRSKYSEASYEEKEKRMRAVANRFKGASHQQSVFAAPPEEAYTMARVY